MTNNNIYFVANWKMNGDLSLINRLKNVINLSNDKKYKKSKIVYCPPYTLISSFVKKTKKSKIQIGSQDCDELEDYGPYTGSTSSKLLKDVGAKYVILGHSEKRNQGDNDLNINLKIKNSIKVNLKVILCVGETLFERKKNKTHIVLKKQITNCLKNIKNIKNIIIAYEPVWSIGTGLLPSSNILINDISKLKKFIKSKYKVLNPVVLYGGSVNSKNISQLKIIDNIDGFLIGGASLNEKNFIDIIKKTFI